MKQNLESLILHYLLLFALAVNFETTYKALKPLPKPKNHPQITNKPAKLPIKHPWTSQTTHKPAKYQTNDPPLTSQKLHCFFPEDIFYELQYFLRPSRARRKTSTFFYVCATFHILSSPLHNSLSSLTADYNPSHKLSTQLWTLTNFSWRLGLTMLHWKFYGC